MAQVTVEEARARITAANEPYKLEILESIVAQDPMQPITIYHIGQAGSRDYWWDLCAGPHVASTGDINPDAVELESVAGEAGGAGSGWQGRRWARGEGIN